MRLVIASMSLGILGLLAGGCDKNGSAEQAGEELDAAMEEVKDGMKEVKEGLQEAGDEIQDAAHEVKQEMKQAGAEMKEAGEEIKEAGKEALPLAWELSTSFLTDAKAPPQAKAEALFRALSLIPELGDDTGKQWLEKTFKNPQGEGVELLASLGTLTAQTRENPDESLRLEQLKLQHAAVTTMLSTKEVDPAAWAGIFTIYAEQWAYEAGVTRQKDQSNSRRMVPQYDEWGNLFFSRPNTGYQGPGAKTVLPSRGGAKVSMRLVPDQDPQKIGPAFARYVREVAPAGVAVEVELFHGAPPFLVEPEGPFVEAALRALEDVWGKRALRVRMLLCRSFSR